ncbi:MAG: VOC family protein [Deltaproteobacteria bacterium]|nr:VOC family protein [Deltaproteobacteria bacterium]
MSHPFELRGYDHIKVTVSDIPQFEKSLEVFGFSKFTGKVPEYLKNPHSIYGSGDAVFCIYPSTHPEAKPHFDLHGDTVFDLSYLVESRADHPMLFEGVGKLKHTLRNTRTFPSFPVKHGVLRFDHNTINVERGEMQKWVDHYLKTFNFNKGQYFDIKGAKTRLYSWVTRSNDFSVQMPFNESADDKSQIEEYIQMHKGGGVQHIALLTKDIISTMDGAMSYKASPVKFLDTPDTYFELLPKRVKIRESVDELRKRKILADQDENGYLLQIFTQNLFSGIFIELIQREGNQGFGEGNFQALFDSIELDQQRRGVI